MSHTSSPSTGGKLLENVQEVRFSDVAAWMPRRNDSNFPKRAGNTNAVKHMDVRELPFGYFSLSTHDCMDAGGRATQERLPEEK